MPLCWVLSSGGSRPARWGIMAVIKRLIDGNLRMNDINRKRLSIGLGVGALCLILLACEAPAQPLTSTTAPTPTREPTATPTSTPTDIPAPSRTRTPTPTPTSTPTSTPAGGSGYFPELFHGCWHLETEDISFEMQLEQRRADVQGTFLLVKICVVDGVRSACRIREGSIEGTVTMNELEITLTIPEYDDEGTALLTLAADRGSLSWQELAYPEVGLADGGTHYLPPTFTLLSCDV